MVAFKCVDCGSDVPGTKTEKELKIEFSNPGTVFVKAEVHECPKCKSRYADEHDAEKLFGAIDAQYSLQNPKK